MAIIFGLADFEEGNTTDWSSTATAGGGAIDAHADAAHNGSWGSRTYSDAAGDRAFGRGTPAAGSATVHIRFWFKADASFSMGNGESFSIFRSNPFNIGIQLKYDGANYEFEFTAAGHAAPGGFTINLNQWYQIDAYWKAQSDVDVADGEIKFWIDTVSHYSSTGVDSNDSGEEIVDTWYGHYVGVDADTNGYIYIDDVTIWDAEQLMGRTTKNTDAFPLGQNVGISLRM